MAALLLLALLLLGSMVFALSVGGVRVPSWRVALALAGHPVEARDAVVVLTLRLPRVLLGVLVGTGLGVAGAALQGLFRNPLADPGLIGVASGAALGAVGVVVLGAALAGLAPVLAKPLRHAAGGLRDGRAGYLCRPPARRWRGRWALCYWPASP